MNTLLAVARAVHFASAVLLFGGLLFLLVVAAPALRSAGPRRPVGATRSTLERTASWALVASLVSWLLWLACEAAAMSGAPLAQAISGAILARVLGDTGFGRLWLLRLAVAVALAILLWRSRASDGPASPARLAALAAAGAYLASLAWAGHAAAGSGAQGWIQLASDAIHLLAAGAWLGALPGLALLLGAKPPIAAAQSAARRFSSLGVISVAALLLTGVINARYLVETLPRLFGTDYGQLLLAKIALFAAMLALAAVNRFSLTRRLARGDAEAALVLRRNAWLEVAAGLAVLSVVGVLGITIPGAHQRPVWPFSRGLDLRPAYPSSYASSPVPYSTGTIARGAVIYAQRCSACHGAQGRGDGPAAASLPVQPTNLAEHAARHRRGDLYWLVAHGVPGTPMAGFAASLDERELWSVVQFLRALSDVDAAQAASATAPPTRPVLAPDFEFEPGAPGQTPGQTSLAQMRGRSGVLLVLYTLPGSLPRLLALESQAQAFERNGLRIVALPTPGAPSYRSASPIVVLAAADASSVYAMLASDAVAAGHAELLIDREGYLRRRWLGVPADNLARNNELFTQLGALAREPLPPAAPEEHAH